jgi:hypothetical protein
MKTNRKAFEKFLMKSLKETMDVPVEELLKRFEYRPSVIAYENRTEESCQKIWEEFCEQEGISHNGGVTFNSLPLPSINLT